MMNSTQQQNTFAKASFTDEESWEQLYERIRAVAHKKTSMLLAEEDGDELFDRGARTLRTLMSAAEIAGRMKRQDEKEQERHDEEQRMPPSLTDEQVRKVYRDIVAKVDRFEAEETDEKRPSDNDTRIVPDAAGAAGAGSLGDAGA